MFAGSLQVIHQWKLWAIYDKKINTRPLPHGIALCMISRKNHLVELCFVDHVEFNSKQEPQAFFAGSGYDKALSCWKVNQSVKQAIETAKSLDVYTGGEVRYFDLNSNLHNLNLEHRAESISETFKKGYMVNTQNSNTHLAIQDNLEHPVVKDFLADLVQGNAALQAPSPIANRLWTQEQIDALDVALSKYYPE